MEKVSLKQVYWGGVTVRIPEIWNVETEEMLEADGGKSYCVGISACGNDVRSIDISYGSLPEGSDAYMEACATYEEVVEEDSLETNSEPILSFDFKGKEAYGFSLATDNGLPCFFFCIENKTNLLTVLICASSNEDIQDMLEFIEEYLDLD